MRNAKVFVILIGRTDLSPTGEEGRSALGLHRKYHGRAVDGITQQVELIAVKKVTGASWHTVDTNLNETTQGQITLADGDKVGMYLVGHVQSYDTHKPVKIILDLLQKRIAAASKVEDAETKKKRPINVELQKLCLVLCRSAFRTVGDSVDTAKPADTPIVVKNPSESNSQYKKRLNTDVKEFGHETSLLAEMCRRLAEAKLFPDMVGYTEAITAVGPGDVNPDGLSKPGLYPQRLHVGQKTRGNDDRTRKLYFVYKPGEGGYMQQSVKDWADRH